MYTKIAEDKVIASHAIQKKNLSDIHNYATDTATATADIVVAASEHCDGDDKKI